jgi:transcriptional regulator with XRE-family HTH domain
MSTPMGRAFRRGLADARSEAVSGRALVRYLGAGNRPMIAARQHESMDDVTVGLVVRALRRRRGWRQIDLAARSGVSQPSVSAMERGHCSTMRVETIRRIFAQLEARLALAPAWRGAELERLLDEDHARVVARVAARLEAMGWQVSLEVTYNEYGDRGSIDILGLLPARRAALVVEVKTDIPSVEAVGRKVDEKARLAPKLVGERHDWRPEAVGRILALPDTMRLRRLIEHHEALGRMFPSDFRALRRWLREPTGAFAGAWFLSDISARDGRGTRRVRRLRSRVS